MLSDPSASCHLRWSDGEPLEATEAEMGRGEKARAELKQTQRWYRLNKTGLAFLRRADSNGTFWSFLKFSPCNTRIGYPNKLMVSSSNLGQSLGLSTGLKPVSTVRTWTPSFFGATWPLWCRCDGTVAGHPRKPTREAVTIFMFGPLIVKCCHANVMSCLLPGAIGCQLYMIIPSHPSASQSLESSPGHSCCIFGLEPLFGDGVMLCRLGSDRKHEITGCRFSTARRGLCTIGFQL